MKTPHSYTNMSFIDDFKNPNIYREIHESEELPEHATHRVEVTLGQLVSHALDQLLQHQLREKICLRGV